MCPGDTAALCPTSSSSRLPSVEPPARFQPVPICHGTEGQTAALVGRRQQRQHTRCGAHAVTLFSFVSGSRHVRSTTSVGRSRYLARCGPWRGAARSGGELEAQLGTEAAPGPAAAWPASSTGTGNGLAH